MKCQKACCFQFSKHFKLLTPLTRKTLKTNIQVFSQLSWNTKQTNLTFCENLVYPTLLKSEMVFVSYTRISSLHMWKTIKRVTANISAKAFPVNNLLQQQRPQIPHLQELSKLIVAAWLFAKTSALERPAGMQLWEEVVCRISESWRTLKRTPPPSL